jgi:hypothetical protein
MDNRETLRRNIEAQGFLGLDDETLIALDPWLRLMPFMTCLTVALSTLLESPLILVGCALVTFAGAVLPRHPVDLIYHAFIRTLESSPALPPTPVRRRIVLVVWSAGMAASGYCFWIGYSRVGILLGWTTAALIGLLAAHQLCLVSELLRRLMGRAGDQDQAGN